MNKYLTNVNRVEFLITMDCTGKCKHCSVGEHKNTGVHIDKDIACEIVFQLAKVFKLESVMTFGGEPLLYPDSVCAVHSAAKMVNVPKRQLITNGFFSKDAEKIKSVSQKIANCGINDILLSVDVFHQETIPVEPVKMFAREIVQSNAKIRISPAWLVSREHDNPYNSITHKIVEEFKQIGLEEATGNVVFPEGNALKYLSEYFVEGEFKNPYIEDPKNVKSVSIEADGTLFGEKVCKENIIKILEEYSPQVIN